MRQAEEVGIDFVDVHDHVLMSVNARRDDPSWRPEHLDVNVGHLREAVCGRPYVGRSAQVQRLVIPCALAYRAAGARSRSGVSSFWGRVVGGGTQIRRQGRQSDFMTHDLHGRSWSPRLVLAST